jgi:hypothetical protein
MDTSPLISVTLSSGLLDHLRQLAQTQHVPLSWLVAGLVCDTMVACNEQTQLTRTSAGRVIPSIRSSQAWN